MEKILISILFGIILINLIISICVIIRRRRKDSQYDKNISTLYKKIESHENLLNITDTNLNSRINDTNSNLSKAIENLENTVKTGYNALRTYANNINEHFNENNDQLRHELKKIDSTLQELKEETYSKLDESNKRITDIEDRIKSIISNYKDLKWQIENFTKIEEDSKRLNDNTDLAQQEELVQAIVNKINSNKKNQDSETTQSNLSKSTDSCRADEKFESSYTNDKKEE